MFSEDVERGKYLSIQQVLDEKKCLKPPFPTTKMKVQNHHPRDCVCDNLSAARNNKNNVWIWSSVEILTMLSLSSRPFKWGWNWLEAISYIIILKALWGWIKVLCSVPCTVGPWWSFISYSNANTHHKRRVNDSTVKRIAQEKESGKRGEIIWKWF